MSPKVTETGEDNIASTAPRAAVPMPAASHPLDPTLTVPKASLGAVAKLPPMSAPSHEALRDRLQRAAQLARQNKATEALGEFEAVYTNYLTLGDPALAIIGAKAAFNRGVLLEKLLADPSRAELAFEKLFGNFGQFDAAEIRAVVARSGLHAARLAAVNQHLDVAVQRYNDRLGPYGEYLPPLELRGFISDYRRLRAELRAQSQGIITPSGLPEIVAEHEIYSLTPPKPATVSGFVPPVPVVRNDAAPAPARGPAETAAAVPPAPTPDIPTAPVMPPAQGVPAAPIEAAATQRPAPSTVALAAPAASDALARTGASRVLGTNVVEFPLAEIARAAEATAAQSSAPTTEQRAPSRPNPEPSTPARASLPPAPASLSRDELRSMLDALDRRMAAYVADVRGEVGSIGSGLSGLSTAMANVQSQHLQLRNELQTQEGMHTQNLNARFHELREDLRDGLADVRSELRALAAEQRHARTVIVAVVLIAAAAVIAATIAF